MGDQMLNAWLGALGALQIANACAYRQDGIQGPAALCLVLAAGLFAALAWRLTK